MAFALRLLDRAAYAQTCDALDRAAAGDDAAWTDLVDGCLALLDGEELRRWNASGALAGHWRDRLERARGGARRASVADVAGIAIALRCAPAFQLSRSSAPQPSPHLVSLGKDDAGLYEALASAAGWLQALLDDGFITREERYGLLGAGMFLLDRGELRRLADLARKVALPPSASPGQVETLARLASLAERALADERYTIAVSSTE